MKNQTTKVNRPKLVAKGMILVFLLTSAVSFFGCYFGPTIGYQWEVDTHKEFMDEIKEYNSTHDNFINTFISFDLDKNENISKRIYHFSTVANRAKVDKFGLCDKICSTWNVHFAFYLKSNIENNEHNEYAYKIGCYYRDVQYNFLKQDEIQIRQGKTRNCGDEGRDFYYQVTLNGYSGEPENRIYQNAYHYEIFVNNTRFGCIHISSIDEASEEKLDEIIQMLLDSLVVINAEDFFIWRDKK